MAIVRTWCQRRVIAVAALAVVSASVRFVNAQETPRPPAAQQAQETDEPEVLLRGPVHEAFAKPVGEQPEPGLVVPKAPPEPVDEIPPDNRPEGNVTWISGYWAWDADREDFLWVSGVWRDVPPGRRWVPGYWTQVEGGHQWVSGFWAAAETTEMTYLPAPPASLEEGPTSPAPGENYFWVPGCWRYVDSDYAWQPGYWSAFYDDWVWTPHHYVWTPRGCLFVNGFWDYGFYDRGYCFAPVYFHHHRHRHFYRPHFALSFGNLLNFFVYPGRRHYFFGDYYGHRNFHPWFRQHRRHHDHLFVHLNTRFRRQGIDYRDRLERRHDFLRDHEDQRPPRTLEAWRDLRSRDGERDGFDIGARDFRELVANGRERFRRTDDDEGVRRQREELRDLTDRRRRAEERRDDRAAETRDGEGRSRIDRPDGRKSGETRKLGTDRKPRLELPPPTTRPSAVDRGDSRQRPDFRPDGGERRPEATRPGRDGPGPDRGDAKPETRRGERGDRSASPRGDIRGGIQRPELERPEIRRPDVQRPQVRPPEQRLPQVRPDMRRPEARPEAPRTNVRPEIRRPESRQPQAQPPAVRRSVPQIQRSQPQRLAPQVQRGPMPQRQIQRSAPAPRRSAPAVRSQGGRQPAASGGGRGGGSRGGGGRGRGGRG
jgi:hypothetical protein